jgi:medium-chain acyl-[acyl-carrier-protein] hydrolase
MTSGSMMNPWLQHWQPRPKARLRLFCFPYAGGAASIFRTWSETLPSEIEVCPVQLPGRENRLMEPAFSHIQPLIATLAQALLPLLDTPYAFFGHSMGALISFELARYLYREDHEGPLHLFASGHRAPHLPDPDPPTSHLPEAAFIEELRKLEGTPEEVLQNSELLQLLLPLLRADFRLCETYQYIADKPLPCPITAFGGLQDSEAPRETVLAWKIHTDNTFKARFFMGGHFFIRTEQSALLQAVITDLL